MVRATISNDTVARRLPVAIHQAPEIEEQASAFVSSNTSSLAVTPLQLFQAGLVANDPDAQTVANVCSIAGVTVLRYPADKPQPGDTVAIGQITKLVNRRGARVAGNILELLARSKFAPIGATEIMAAEFLLTQAEFRGGYKVNDVIEAIDGHRDELEKRGPRLRSNTP